MSQLHQRDEEREVLLALQNRGGVTAEHQEKKVDEATLPFSAETGRTNTASCSWAKCEAISSRRAKTMRFLFMTRDSKQDGSN